MKRKFTNVEDVNIVKHMAELYINFEKKELKKGGEFPNQLVFEEEIKLEDITIDVEKYFVTLNFGRGHIEIKKEDAIKILLGALKNG